MRVIRGIYNLNKEHQGCALTIGKFDGVHLGHQQLLEQITVDARTKKIKSMVMIFEPSPVDFFNKEPVDRIIAVREKMIALSKCNVDFLLVVTFNQAFAKIKANDFIKDVLVEKLAINKLWVGDDFCFGAKRLGDFQLLSEKAKQYNYSIGGISSFNIKGQRVSSSMIRELIQRHQFKEVKTLMNRAYTLSGKIIKNRQLGRTMGFPTANLSTAKKSQRGVLKLLPLGVYIVEMTLLASGKKLQGVANFGFKPTIKSSQLTFETFCLNFSGNLYGEKVIVEVLCFIRGEKKFNSLEELKNQIQQDVEATKQYFFSEKC